MTIDKLIAYADICCAMNMQVGSLHVDQAKATTAISLSDKDLPDY